MSFKNLNDIATSFAQTLLDDTSASDARTTLGLGTIATQNANAVAITGGTIVVSNTGLAILDSNASHNLTFTTSSDLTANRSLTFVTGDADRTVTLSGNTTLSGTNSGDQNTFLTIAVSGQSDVVADTGSGTLTLVAGTNVTITTSAGGDSITINATGSSLADNDYIDIVVSGGGTVWTIDTDVVTNAKLANMAANTFKANNTGGSADPVDITVAQAKTLLAYTTGDIGAQPLDATLTALAGVTTAADQVIYATGSDAFTTTGLTSFARSILDDTSAGAVRTTLGIDTDDAVTFGDLTVSSLIVNGTTTTVNSATLTVDDPLIKVADGNGADTVDVGIYGEYLDSIAKYTGLFRDATDGKYKLFTLLEVAPTTTVNTGGTGYATATLIANLESSSVTITGGSITGITDLAVADGGTGASDAGTARTNLGVAIGSNVQAWDATLDAFAAYSTNGLITQTAANTFTGRTLTGTTNEIVITNGNGVSGNPQAGFAANVVFSGSVTVPNASLFLLDNADTFYLSFDVSEGLSANRNLAIIVNDANRTLTISGDATISGTNTGNQTITLTTDVTGSGTGSFAATIANNAVTNAKAADMAANTFKANNTGSTADPVDITVAQAKTLLAYTPGDIGAQTLDATLTALAGVTTAADQVIYATGSDAFTTTGLSSFARTIIDDTSAGAVRTTLGIDSDDPVTFGEITSAGSIYLPLTTRTTGLTLSNIHYTVLCDTTSGGFTITLPTAIGAAGRIYNIKKIIAANTVTINTTSSQTIDGATSRTITTQWENVQVQSDNANWFIL